MTTFVAVAVIHEYAETSADDAASIVAKPVASAVTSAVPTSVFPWPKPDGSGTGLLKNWMRKVAFGVLESVEHAISPGNRTPRGDATVAAILGYCGRPVRLWRDGRWQHGHGWMLTRHQQFPFGRRWVGLCEVPDLELFPARYSGVQSVLFRAGLELRRLHFGTLAAAWLVRLGLVRDLARHAPRLRRLSEWFLDAGSDVGGMVVELSGRDAHGQPLRLRWSLSAAAGDGPHQCRTYGAAGRAREFR